MNIPKIASIVTLADRPDLAGTMWAVPGAWPAFMDHDPVANLFYHRLPEIFPAYQLVALDTAGTAIGRINSVPFAWTGHDTDLPARGWDAILERAFTEQANETPPTAVSLLEARIAPAHRGAGLSTQLLQAAHHNATRHGLPDLFGPVRPTGKAVEPHTPMPEYAARTRPDGLPDDPWMRVHARLGARTVTVCPLSMTIAGTLDQWRTWTGLPLHRSGPTPIPGALVPVHVAVADNHAVYIEPNVWMHHPRR